jgi:arylsulfatase A-like enzyme
MRPPNVLLVVWDACRLDAAREHAPTLARLAEDNLRFENAITPAGYSLPSHVSLLTGEYPHDHGIYHQEHTIDRQPLLDELGERGYRRDAVSANGFASAMYSFDRGFDRFYNTQGQMVYPEGLDVHAYAARARDEGGEVRVGSLGRLSLVREVLGHDHPLKSIANVCAAGTTEVVRRYPALERVPHRRFSRTAEFSYDPARNTRTIRRLLGNHARSSDDGPEDHPFFLFTNYMDPHHPYAPPGEYQRGHCGRTFPLSELRELADRTHPLKFLQRHEEGETLPEDVLETVRNLYAGEVERADDHLARLLDALEAHDLREETIVVVTADHGENLGEVDTMGEARFGHILSASDHLLRVPLVVAHPELEGRTVEEYVSTKDLYGLCTDPEPLLDSGGRDLGPLAHDGPVAAELPAYLNEVLWERYPGLRKLLARSVSVAYDDGWKAVATSADEVRAFHDGEERPPGDAPDAVRETARENLERMPSESVTGHGLSEEAVSHLEALGYV